MIPDVFRKVEMSTPGLPISSGSRGAWTDWCSGQLRDYCPVTFTLFSREGIEGIRWQGLGVFALWVGYR